MSGEEAGYDPAYIGTMLGVCAIAVLLNIVVIVLIFKVGEYRTSVDIFVTNLAVSDMIQAGIVLPIHFQQLSRKNRDFHGGKDHYMRGSRGGEGSGHPGKSQSYKVPL